MVGERPNVNAASRYSINETCKLLGIERTTLYRQTKRRNIEQGLHKLTGKPFYTGLAIMKFWNAEKTVDRSCRGARGRRNSCA